MPLEPPNRAPLLRIEYELERLRERRQELQRAALRLPLGILRSDAVQIEAEQAKLYAEKRQLQVAYWFEQADESESEVLERLGLSRHDFIQAERFGHGRTRRRANRRSARLVLTTSGHMLELDEDEATDAYGWQMRDRDLSPDNATATDFMAHTGWSAQKAGATGNPRGRPPMGMSNEVMIRDEIAQRSNGFALEDMLQAKRGPARDALDTILAELIYRRIRPLNRQSFCDLADWDRSTLSRRARRGRTLLQQKSPKGGESNS
jgi:hypothetical protein